MIDLLHLATGSIVVPEDAEEGLETALGAAAYNFVAGGGRPTLTEWAALSEASRRALVDAQAQVAYDRAALQASLIVRMQRAPATVEVEFTKEQEKRVDFAASGSIP